jgi:type IV pilus assembly protein PilW
MKSKQMKTQKGLSLIELMIAISLSIVVVAAMIGLFVNSKENYRMNENMSRLQENARFAVSFLARDLRMADYRACVTDDRLPLGISGVNDGGLNNSDSVTILWQSNACTAGANTVTTIYTIEAGASGNSALFRTVDGTRQELVEGIQNLQILYGQDTDNDDVPNFWAAANNVTDWAQAVSVRISLIAQTLEANLAADGTAISRNFTSTVTLRNRLP